MEFANAVETSQLLTTQVAQAQTAAQQQAQAQGEAQRQLAAERAALDRMVRQRIALAPPDRWPDTPLAHERTVALVALHTTLQPGTTGKEPVRR